MSIQKEAWKTITIEGKKPSVAYVVSNHGRFGVLVNGKVEVRTFKPTGGNYRYNTRQQGKNKAIFIYKEVARAFLKKPSAKHTFIVHKDHNYLNDHVENLKWATHEEHRAHTAMSPKSIQARQKKAIITSSHSRVLDEKKVTALKKMIWDPKRKLSYKQLAAKFGVSEMQIYRIKTGEFWYHVRVENEPLHAKYTKNLSNLIFQEKKAEKEELEKGRREATKKALAAKRAIKLSKKKALAIARQRALSEVRAKKLREKQKANVRYRKILELAKSQKIKEIQAEKASSKKAAKKSSSTKFSLIKISGRRKK